MGRGLVTLHHGDCIEVMAAMEPESVDAIVTDPPYDLTNRTPDVKACEACGRVVGGGEATTGGKPAICPRCGGPLSYQRSVQGRGFMGKAWDGTGIAFRPEMWAECLRVAKPSAYLLAFGGTRTVHRMTCAIEDAGWIVRDMLVWAYASGFPKSRALLKPAWEPIVMARKPGPLRELAIDACRIGYISDVDARPETRGVHASATAYDGLAEPGGAFGGLPVGRLIAPAHPAGRWPANVILTDPVFDGGWDGVVGGGEATTGGNINGRPVTGYGKGWADERFFDGYGDSGTYSRFFLVPKAARSDREPVLGGLPDGFAPTMGNGIGGRQHDPANVKAYRANVHPTVKPTELMRHLVRLVTPTGGTVLDPFLGSGTTALAAEMEGFAWVGIEREAEYVAIAEARLNGTQRGLGLEASS